MTDAEDPAILAELQFEQIRRFTDSWVTNVTETHFSRHVAKLAGRPFWCPGPCTIHLAEVNQHGVLSIFRSANPAFNKLAALLLCLTEQMHDIWLQLELEICPKLMIFGEEPEAGVPNSREGDAQILMAKGLPFLRESLPVLERLCKLTENLLLQLGSLCAEHTRKATILQVATSLAWLLRIEILLSRNPNIASAFAMLARMLESISTGNSDFDKSEVETAMKLQLDLAAIRNRLFGKGLFRRFLEDNLASGSEAEELTSVSGRIADHAELIGDRDSLVGILAASVLVFRLGRDDPSFDKKLLRQLLDLHIQSVEGYHTVQVPLLPVFSEHMLQPASFLSQYLPNELEAYIPAAYARQAAATRAQSLDRGMEEFDARLQHSALAVAAIVGAFSNFSESTVTEGLLTQMANTILRALTLACQTKQTLLDMLTRLKLSGSAVTKITMRMLNKAACQVKAIEQAYQRHQASVAEALPHLLTHVNSGSQGLLAAMGAAVRAKMRQAAGTQSLLTIKSKRERAVAALQQAAIALDAASKLAKGPVSSMQLSGMEICLEAVATTGSVPDADLSRLYQRLHTLHILQTLEMSIHKACCLDFLYFNRHLLEAGLRDLVAHPEEARMLPALLAAYGDGHLLLLHTSLESGAAHKAYEEELKETLLQNLLIPVCNKLETQLRLHHHTLQSASETESTAQPPDIAPILRLDPLLLHSQLLHPRKFVEEELSRRFHNHTAVALHDWQTYAQLAALAKARLQLSVQKPDLPGLVLDPGLDLVEIMRELPAFTAGYAFSLVSNTFVQRADRKLGTKHLMTLGVTHVINSLRKHGASLAGAVVQAVRSLLSRQMSLLSQWLAQSEVKARLSKEVRAINETAQASTGARYRYPFAAAETLTQDFKRLGSAANGSTYLDYLGSLVTEIGNGIALMQLVQHGIRRHKAGAAEYLNLHPGETPPRYSANMDARLGQELGIAAKLLDKAAERICPGSKLEPGIFSLLQPATLQYANSGSLANLYAVATALILNAVEGALLSKEQLPHRKSGSVALAFSNDGFAIGLTFLLKAQDQDAAFAALHWFESAADHYEARKTQLGGDDPSTKGAFSEWLGKLRGSQQVDRQAQNRELALAQLDSYAAEFRLVRNTICCAIQLLRQ